MNKHELSRRIYNQKTVEKIENKIKLLGLSKDIETIDFLNSRLIACILIFFMSLYLFKFGFIIGPLLTLISYYLLSPFFIISLNKLIKLSMQLSFLKLIS